MAAFDYTARDYDTIKSDLFARAARVLPDWTDRDPSDFGVLLVDLWAYSADIMHYYIDRAAGEAFLPTATQRESVLALANLLDYVPRGRTSAVGQVTLSNTNGVDHVVDPYTTFIARYNNETYQMYTDDGGTIPASSTGAISLKEGALYEDEVLTGASNGRSSQRYIMANTGVVAESVVVNVYEDGINPTQYQRVPRITSSDTGDKVFAINVNADNEVEIVFGTTLNGFIPPSGSVIKTTYAVSSGNDGNLPSGSVTGWASATPTGLSVVSSTSFAGGVDEESITALKRSIPNVISAQNRAVTKNDFIALTTQLEGVSKATVSYAPGVTTGASAGASVTNASVTVYPQIERGSDYLTTGDTSETVSATLQQQVIDAIQPKALLGVDVVPATTIDWTPIDLQVTVYVNERYVSNWVLADVTEALDELFDFDNVFFGQRLSLGQVYRIILNVPGVEYAVATAFDVTPATGLQTDILIDPLSLPKKGTYVITMEGGITTS